MKRIGIGTRVRFVGQDFVFNDVTLLMLLGYTGTVRAVSVEPGMDWFVEMDDGCFDIDARESALRRLDDQSEPAIEQAEEAFA